MPLSECYIEQTNRNPDRWVGRAKISGSSNYVINVLGSSFEEAWVAVREAYYSKRPDERPAHILIPDHVAAGGVNRAVKNSPPPLDDVGGCAKEIADEKDPDFHDVVTVPTACALCGVVDIDWQAHILSPSHIAVMAAHQMPKRKKVLSEEHKRKMVEGRGRARLARQEVGAVHGAGGRRGVIPARRCA